MRYVNCDNDNRLFNEVVFFLPFFGLFRVSTRFLFSKCVYIVHKIIYTREQWTQITKHRCHRVRSHVRKCSIFRSILFISNGYRDLDIARTVNGLLYIFIKGIIYEKPTPKYTHKVVYILFMLEQRTEFIQFSKCHHKMVNRKKWCILRCPFSFKMNLLLFGWNVLELCRSTWLLCMKLM